MSDVSHPKHYQGKNMEVIDIIEAFDLDFHLGNVIKYILRAGKKESELIDLEKAIWYLQRKREKLIQLPNEHKPNSECRCNLCRYIF